MMRHGGKILSDQLVKLGVRRVFSVPGESFLAALDGLHDADIQNVVCRHPRAGGVQCVGRYPCGDAGQHADGVVCGAD
jgi:thiamine pyrophosphate-dependent acetolactate synthase large subunit-like protein